MPASSPPPGTPSRPAPQPSKLPRACAGLAAVVVLLGVIQLWKESSVTMPGVVYMQPPGKKTLAAVTYRLKSYSQFQEDLSILGDVFTDKATGKVLTGGVFLEIGALDGVLYSNTKMFEDQLGWRGILIEAARGNAAKLLAPGNRPNSAKFFEGVCASGQKFMTMVGEEGAVPAMPEHMSEEFRHVYHEDGSSYQVPCRPLGDLVRDGLKELGLPANTTIDFMSIDVEGSELQVLNTFDWSHPVHTWMVEALNDDPAKDDAVRALFREKGYVLTDISVERVCKEKKKKHCPPINDVFQRPK